LVGYSQSATLTTDTLLRRLFSTFAQGWPGAGLLILRLVACSAVFNLSLRGLEKVQPDEPAILQFAAIAAMIAGALLAVGLWTPVSGCMVAATALWGFIAGSGDPWANTLLATIGAALSMIGPGVWSLDSRLFGWKRILIRDKQGIPRNPDG
jgi:putative oxidoreductase